MSFILKTLEKLIDKNIRGKELEINKLNGKQYAYQEGKGTEAALHDITAFIDKSLKKQGVALAVFIDIEGAFDNTAYSVIEKAARDKTVNEIATEWIKAMLASRIISVRTEKTKIRIKPVKGCPQGGCLSPLLWCMVVDSLIVELEALGCHITAYADDLAIVLHGNNAEVACEKMNEIMKVIENWCTQNQLHVNPSKTTMVKFTRCTSEAKNKMKRVKLFNEELKTEQSFKYLGIHLDSKLLMNKHIEECVAKGMRSLWAARALVARTWGLTPQIAAWIYKMVIIPRITYGSIIWWHRAKLITYAKRLDKIHRLAMLMITGAMKSTPTLGMSAALELLPLDILSEIRARDCYERLRISNTWNVNSENTGHGTIANTIDTEHQMDQLDRCAKTWNFGKKFKVEIHERDVWDNMLVQTPNQLIWYSDGSKTDTATGLGIYCEELQVKKSARLSDHSTVMQAETLAIKTCAETMIQSDVKNRNIFILSDSQAALKAITKCTVSTRTVKDCILKLNLLGRDNNLTLSWVPGHAGIPGNEMADELANEGAKLANITITTPIPGSIRISNNRVRGEKLFRDIWNRNRGLKHSKLMMEPFKKGKNYLIRMKRKDLRVAIGILTGHCCLKKFLNRIGKADDPYCRYCNEEVDENMAHLLTECPALTRYRLNLFNHSAPIELQLRNTKISELLKFAKATEIYETFFRDE